MKIQWSFISALLFALIVAVFAVINVEPVQVNYLFGTAEIPLILIILGSALLGGLITGSFGVIRSYQLSKQIKQLTKEKTALEKRMEKDPVQEKETKNEKLPEKHSGY